MVSIHWAYSTVRRCQVWWYNHVLNAWNSITFHYDYSSCCYYFFWSNVIILLLSAISDKTINELLKLYDTKENFANYLTTSFYKTFMHSMTTTWGRCATGRCWSCARFWMLTLVGMATRSAMLTVGGATGLISGDEMAAFIGCCCIEAAFHMICCPAGSTGFPDTSAQQYQQNIHYKLTISSVI